MEIHQPQTAQKSTYRSTGLKVLSAAGFVIVLIFGAWGVIQVARSLPQVGSAISAAAVSLTSIFVPAETLQISTSSGTITSGAPFTLVWTHAHKSGSGTYSVSFDCRDGLTMQAIGSNGVYQPLSCNTPFNVSDDATSVKLIPLTSTGTRFLDVPFKVAYTRLSDGVVAVSAEATFTITGSDTAPTTPTTVTTPPATQTPATPAPTTPAPTKPAPTPAPTQTTYTVVGRQSDPNGRPDLAVTILDAGSANGYNTYNNYNGYNNGYTTYNGTYYGNNVIRRGDRGIVHFVVENVGTKTSAPWTFNAVLPTLPMYIYSSDLQTPLAPGEKIQFTLGFDQADAGATNGAVTINVDPNNTMWDELNKNNNVAKAYLTIVN